MSFKIVLVSVLTRILTIYRVCEAESKFQTFMTLTVFFAAFNHTFLDASIFIDFGFFLLLKHNFYVES